jgi:N-methylhydantoinase A
LAAALRAVGGDSPFSLAKDEPRLVAAPAPLTAETPVATLRDAALLTGRAWRPDPDAQNKARQRLEALGASRQWTAAQVAEMLLAAASTQLTEALWSVSVEYGQDPADYPLLGYGSAAGLVAAEVADRLGMQSVLVPPAAGLVSAYGALSAPVLRERFRVIGMEASGAQQRGNLEATLRAMTEELRRDLRAEGQNEAAYLSGLQWFADLRYAGQSHSLTLPGIGEGGPAQDGTTDLVVRFHQEHQRRYGFTIGERPVELTGVRVRAAVPVAAPGFAQFVQLGLELSARAAAPATLPAGVIAYSALEPEAAVAGPAVLYEESACTYVPAGWHAQLDKHGAIWLRRPR